jgi:hypothetical protein
VLFFGVLLTKKVKITIQTLENIKKVSILAKTEKKRFFGVFCCFLAVFCKVTKICVFFVTFLGVFFLVNSGFGKKVTKLQKFFTYIPLFFVKIFFLKNFTKKI